MEYTGKHHNEMLTDLEIEADELINADLSINIDKELRFDDQTRTALQRNLIVFAESMVGFSLSYHVPLRLNTPLLIWDENGLPLETKHIDIYIAPGEGGNTRGFLIDFSSDNFEGLTGDLDKDAHLNSMLRKSLTVVARQDSSNEGSYRVFSSGIVPYSTSESIPKQEVSDGYLSILHEIMDEDFRQLAEYGCSYGDGWVQIHNDEPALREQW